MHYLIAGLPKSGTTILFSRLAASLAPPVDTYFEPDSEIVLNGILNQAPGHDTLTKVLVGQVGTPHSMLAEFDKHVLIYRDPRDQFISMLLYLFYDFCLNADDEGYQRARSALEKKVSYPGEISSIALYNEIAVLLDREPARVFRKLQTAQRDYIAAFRPFAISYESFVDGDIDQLEDVLGLRLDVNAQVATEHARVSRSQGYGEWQDWFTEEDCAYANAHWGQFIAELGYAADASRSAAGISRRTSLDYVARFNPSLS